MISKQLGSFFSGQMVIAGKGISSTGRSVVSSVIKTGLVCHSVTKQSPNLSKNKNRTGLFCHSVTRHNVFSLVSTNHDKGKSGKTGS
jgi:hypothetical protein